MQLSNTDGEQRHPWTVCVYKFQLIEHPAMPEAMGVYCHYWSQICLY